MEFSFWRASIPGSRRAGVGVPGAWCIVTARNPMSRVLDEASNAARDAELDAALARERLESCPAENRAADGLWREPARMVVGISRERGLAIARRFGQRAIVWSGRGKVGLLDCRTEAWVVRPTYAA